MDKIIFSCLLLTISALGCNTYPTTKVSTVDSRPTLSFTGASPASVVFVDGIGMGPAAQYDGNPKVLVVTSGTHEVTVKEGSNTVFQQSVFVESENKIISIH